MKKAKFKVNYLSNEITEVVNKCKHKTQAIWATDCAEMKIGFIFTQCI